MDARRSAVKEPSDLGYREFQSCFLDSLGAPLVVRFFQFQIKFAGDVRTTQRKRAPDGGQALNGEHAGKDRTLNAHTAQSCYQFKIFPRIEKKLGDDEIRACLDFTAKVFAIVIE